MRFLPKYGTIEVWAVARLAWPNAKTTRAATRWEVSGTRARISSTSIRGQSDRDRCDLTVDCEPPANVMLGISRENHGVVPAGRPLAAHGRPLSATNAVA